MGVNYRANQSFGDWMRQVEKRLMHEERRPLIRNAADLMGPGLAPYTVETSDWNGPETAFNGMFFSQPGALNSPDDTMYWIGLTQGTTDGAGYQLVHDFDPITGDPMGESKIRYFYTPPGAQRIFTDWTDYGGGGGGGTMSTAGYTWVPDPMAMPMVTPRAAPPPSEDPVEAGTVVGGEIPATGDYGHMHISQIDANGFNNDYFEVLPGQILVVQSTDGGVHQLQAVSREAYSGAAQGTPDYASIDYLVTDTDGIPVLNKDVNVTLQTGETPSGFLQDFNFASPTQIWNLAHNQGTKAISVYTKDTNGDQLIGEVLYPDDNTIRITFAFPETGTATVYR